MKKNNKKGFTLVELVIVIAVIAILSAILVPTFSNIISNANATAAQADAKAAITSYLADTMGEGKDDLGDCYIYYNGFYMSYKNGNLSKAYSEISNSENTGINNGSDKLSFDCVTYSTEASSDWVTKDTNNVEYGFSVLKSVSATD